MRAIDADALTEIIHGMYAEGDNPSTYHVDAEGDTLIGKFAVVDAIFNMPTIQPEPHWIPVEQDLPKENYLDDGYVEPSQPVLVYMNYHAYKISRYWGHRKSKGTSDYVIPDWMDLEEYDGDNVIAWMPLPKPFKEVTE